MEDDTGADDETGAVAPIATAVPPVPPTSPCPGINVGVPEPACENYPLMLHSQLRLPFAVTFDHKMCKARRGDNSWVARWVFIYSRPVLDMPGA